MSSGKKDTILIWGGTAVVALLIIGAAVFLTRAKPEKVEPQPAPVTVVLPEEPAPEEESPAEETAPVALPGTPMVLSMPGAITPGRNRLPLDYTCYRANARPPLAWAGAPAGTKSFAVIMERRKDGEKPFVHWLVFNIPADAVKIPAAALAATNDHGVAGYTGPCDPKGKVNYVFRLLALDIVPALPAGAKKDEVFKAIEDHILGEAQLPVIHYNRL